MNLSQKVKASSAHVFSQGHVSAVEALAQC